jgi:ubiquinone/menaquinone biosynthesis C-methylase UbiE
MQQATSDTLRREFFNERAENWLDMWYKDEKSGRYSKYDEAFDRLFELAALRPGDAVLDLGCGSGVLVPYILDRIGPQGRLQEVDYAAKMIEVNRRLHDDPRVTFTVAGVDTMDMPAAGFDVTFCFSCFPHFQRKAESLKAIHQALQPGGKVIVAHFDSSADINAHHRKHACVMHDQLPAAPAMRKLLVDAGFTVEHFIDESGFYYVSASKAPAPT